MKQSYISSLITILMSMVVINAYAYDLAVENSDGVTIYYNYINDAKELAVTNGETGYVGNVIIPEEVTYMSRTRRVTEIGDGAFSYCKRLTSVAIPNSVTRIGNSAFSYCKGDWYSNYESLTSVAIPNSVTEIGDLAFYNCSLTSVTIPNSVHKIGRCAFSCTGLTSVTIPNSVTEIGEAMFDQCHSLISATIPNNMTIICESMFGQCDRLTAVSIPNGVTEIGAFAFSGCSSLTSVSIPNGVTEIGAFAFRGCSSLTSVSIPNSVTEIGEYAFYGCTGLTSVTIPNSVQTIGGGAFSIWNLPVVISLIENPFKINGKEDGDNSTFNKNTFINATLYVPVGTIDKYKATDGWKDFFFIEEGTGTGGGGTTTIDQCEKPTISYNNGKLTFASGTEGATCQYNITDTDINAGSGNEVQLAVTYNISVYATKAGYENSETAKATLCWVDLKPTMEGISNNISQIPARAMLIQSEGGMLTIQGIEDGSAIAVYNVSGQMVGSTKASGNHASLATNIKNGEVAIIKIGEKSVKVVIQ